MAVVSLLNSGADVQTEDEVGTYVYIQSGLPYLILVLMATR